MKSPSFSILWFSCSFELTLLCNISKKYQLLQYSHFTEEEYKSATRNEQTHKYNQQTGKAESKNDALPD